MGLFGKLFEKKECSVCGGEIGLLGNRKLEDGNLCKTCAKKLSPWFNERRHSTVEEIKQQLAYREENSKKVAQFSSNRTIGERYRVMVDDKHQWVTVTTTRNMAEENPDILDFKDITGCRMDIDETRNELFREGPDNQRLSYNPPRYEYIYCFNVIISVSNPYFDEMRFQLNDSTVKVEQGVSTGVGGSFGRILDSLASSGFDPMNDREYRQYYTMAQDICNEMDRVRQVAQGGYAAAPVGCGQQPMQQQPYGQQPMQQPMQQAAPAVGPWVCPACGGQNVGNFCEFCGTKRP